MIKHRVSHSPSRFVFKFQINPPNRKINTQTDDKSQTQAQNLVQPPPLGSLFQKTFFKKGCR